MKVRTKKVSAKATTYNYQIEVTAKITNSGNLTPSEMEEVKRKFKHSLSSTIPKLPFSDLYPFEVEVR